MDDTNGRATSIMKLYSTAFIVLSVSVNSVDIASRWERGDCDFSITIVAGVYLEEILTKIVYVEALPLVLNLIEPLVTGLATEV